MVRARVTPLLSLLLVLVGAACSDPPIDGEQPLQFNAPSRPAPAPSTSTTGALPDFNLPPSGSSTTAPPASSAPPDAAPPPDAGSSSLDAAPSADADTPPTKPPQQECGSKLCAVGLVCCNASCGICTLPGGGCSKQLCLEK